jgi:molybdopterin-binding protein
VWFSRTELGRLNFKEGNLMAIGIEKLSARNQLKGTVAAIDKGPVSAKVKIDIGGGVFVTSSITSESVDDLGLAIGDEVVAIIKSSDVIIGK